MVRKRSGFVSLSYFIGCFVIFRTHQNTFQNPGLRDGGTHRQMHEWNGKIRTLLSLQKQLQTALVLSVTFI
jgi:hypothetical protein